MLLTIQPSFNLTSTPDPLYQIEKDPRLGCIANVHADVVAQLYPQQAAFAKALIPALTFNLNPPLAVLATLVVLKNQLDKKRYGIMASLQTVRMPLFILTFTDGRLERFLTPVIAAARQSWLTFNMASKNRPLMDVVCKEFGVKLITSCCCSVMMTAYSNGERLTNSDIMRQQDYVRSAADRLATPVNLVDDINTIPHSNADLSTDEIDMFAQIDDLLNSLSKVSVVLDEDKVIKEFEALRLMAERSQAVLM